MATTKTRINISVSKGTCDALKLLAKRDQEPVATKAMRLIEQALELEEDAYLSAIAGERLAKKARYVRDSDAVWK